jgi:glyoxylase-like metal-dependent hydrolase (beta-lactamase superfamily II)
MPGPVFTTDFSTAYGEVEEVAPGIRRVVAENPGPFTFYGTGTYVVGRGSVAVIDPGPELPAHVDALCRALDGETVDAILVTHTHRDHSPATSPLRERLGGTVYGFGQPPAVEPLPGDEGAYTEGNEEPFDRAFRPDVVVGDGAVVEGDGWAFDVLHTPGHIGNHLCFALRGERVLFPGDHVMGWSTTVVSPPEGDMRAYVANLERLLERDDTVYWPTHGPAVRDPQVFVASLVEHRRTRERQVLDALAAAPATPADLVPGIYPGLDERLHKAAARSLLGHLVALTREGVVEVDGPLGGSATYRLA